MPANSNNNLGIDPSLLDSPAVFIPASDLDQPLANSPSASSNSPLPPPPNERPRWGLNTPQGGQYALGDTISLEGWVEDLNGSADIDRIDLELTINGDRVFDLGQIAQFVRDQGNSNRATFRHNLDLKNLAIEQGVYNARLEGIIYDRSGNGSFQGIGFNLTNHRPNLNFNFDQREYNTSEIITFENSWVEDADGLDNLSHIDLKLRRLDQESIIDLDNITEFIADGSHHGRFNYSLDLNTLNLPLRNSHWRLEGHLFDKAGNSSQWFDRDFGIRNHVPDLRFDIDNNNYSASDTITLRNVRVEDYDGIETLDRIDFKLSIDRGGFFQEIDLADVTEFIPDHPNAPVGTFDYTLDLSTIPLPIDPHYRVDLQGLLYDKTGNVSAKTSSFYIENYEPHFSFDLDRSNYSANDTLTLSNTRIEDGIGGINRIDFRAIVLNEDRRVIDVADAVSFTPNDEHSRDGTFEYSLDLTTLNLAIGRSYDIILEGIAITQAGQTSQWQSQNINVTHHLPQNLNFSLDRQSYTSNDTLSITGGSIYDPDSATDIDRIDFRIRTANGMLIDLPDVTSFNINASSPDLATFNYNFDLSTLPLDAGIHGLTLEAIAFDRMGNSGAIVNQGFQLTQELGFSNGNDTHLNFSLNQQDYALGETLTLENVWVEDFDGIADIDRIDFFVQSDRGTTIDIADVTQFIRRPGDPNSATFNYSFDLKKLGLEPNSDRNFTLVGIAYDQFGRGSQWRDASFAVHNYSPNFDFNFDSRTYGIGETLTLDQTWVEDPNGLANLDRIDFRAIVNGQSIDLPDVTEFASEFGNHYRGFFDYSLDLWTLPLLRPNENYNIQLEGILYDKAGNNSHRLERHFSLNTRIPRFERRLEGGEYSAGDTLTLQDTWVGNFENIADIDRISVVAIVDGRLVDLPDITKFIPLHGNHDAIFEYNLDLASLGLDLGYHNVELIETLYNKAGHIGDSYRHNFGVINERPRFQFSIEGTNSLAAGDTLTLRDTWVEDGNGLGDIDRIDFLAIVNGNEIIDLPDVTQFLNRDFRDPQGSFEYNLDLKTLGLDINRSHQVYLEGTIFDKVGNTTAHIQQFNVSNHLPHVDFSLDRTQYGFNDTLNLEGWVEDADGIAEIDRLDLRLHVRNEDRYIDIAEITNIGREPGNLHRGIFNHHLDLESLGLDFGSYELFLEMTAYDRAGNGSRQMAQSFYLANNNNIPQLNFNLSQVEYRLDDTIVVTEGWVEDLDGFTNLDRIEFSLRNLNNDQIVDVVDTDTLIADPMNFNRGTFNYSLDIGSLNLSSGQRYALEGTLYDRQGHSSPLLKKGFAIAQAQIAPQDLRFSLDSSKYTPTATVFLNDGWVMDGNSGEDITRVDLRLFDASNNLVADLNDVMDFEIAAWDSLWVGFSTEVNLDGLNLADGTYTMSAIAYDLANNTSNWFKRSFAIEAPAPNITPTNLTFSLDRSTYQPIDVITLGNGWVRDENGADTLDRIDLRIITEQGSTLDIDDISNLSPASWNREWGSFQHELNLSGLNLQTGSHKLVGIAYDRQGAASQQFERGFRLEVPQPNLDPTNLRFTLNKSTYNPTDTLTIGNGWIQDGDGANDLDRITFKIITSNGSEIDLGESNNFTNVTWSQNWAAFSGSFDLSQYNLSDGDYTLIGTALDQSGGQSQSLSRSFTIQAPQANNTAPSKLQFGLSGSTFSVNDTLQITNGWVYDDDGNSDLVGIDFELVAEDGTVSDLSDSFDLTAASWDTTKRWSNFRHNLNLSALGLSSGRYSLRGKAYDQAGDYSNTFLKSFTIV